MKFTPLQLGWMAANFSQFADEELSIVQWATIVEKIQEFIGLGDPYDNASVIAALKFIQIKRPTEKNLEYFVAKVIYFVS